MLVQVTGAPMLESIHPFQCSTYLQYVGTYVVTSCSAFQQAGS